MTPKNACDAPTSNTDRTGCTTRPAENARSAPSIVSIRSRIGRTARTSDSHRKNGMVLRSGFNPESLLRRREFSEIDLRDETANRVDVVHAGSVPFDHEPVGDDDGHFAVLVVVPLFEAGRAAERHRALEAF